MKSIAVSVSVSIVAIFKILSRVEILSFEYLRLSISKVIHGVMIIAVIAADANSKMLSSQILSNNTIMENNKLRIADTNA